MTILMRKFLFAGVDEERYGQIHLVRSWCVSFYATNKSCCIRKISCVDDSSHKLRQILRQYRWSSISRSPTGRECTPSFCVSLLFKVITGALNFKLLTNDCCAINKIKYICHKKIARVNQPLQISASKRQNNVIKARGRSLDEQELSVTVY